jgi:adenosylcobinamide-GDP ribazoletransferase
VSSLTVAVAFLTRAPVPATGRLDRSALGDAAIWFPIVGALVGLVSGGTRALAELAVPATAATVLAIAVGVLATGALHEDGLADTADGFGAHAGRARRLEIMRDPRNGTFGTVALGLVVLLAFTLVVSLDTGEAARVFVIGHVLSRWAILVHAATTPAARPDGAGALLHVGATRLGLATLVAVAICAVTGPLAVAAAATAAALAVAGLMTIASRRAIGGATGDTYGATAKIAEVAAYGVAAAML